MSSTHETGHEKNVANFKTLIEYLETLPKYNPTEAGLQNRSTLPQYTAARGLQDAMGVLENAHNRKVKEQEILFAGLSPFVTRYLSSGKSFLKDPKLAERFVSLAKKITGSGKGKPKPPADGNTPGDGGVSTSYQSYDNKVANFGDMIEVMVEAGYTSNEAEFETGAVRAYHAQLLTATQNVDTAYFSYKNGMEARNLALYGTGGLLETVAAIKLYLRSIYSLRTAESKYINTLKFSTLKK